MSHSIEIPQRVHLLDSSGQVTVSFVPEGVLQQLLAERERLLEDVNRLQQALSQAETERERYRHSFESLEGICLPLLRKDQEEVLKSGVTFEQVIAELERDLKPMKRSNGDG